MDDDGRAQTIPAARSAPSSDRSPPLAPDPRYVMQRLLGRGGMGEVWLAHDQRIDRDIAIKMMRGDRNDPDAVARFLREARVQGRLDHPAIVPVHDLGDADQAPYFAMKRLTGATLADVLASAELRERWPRRLLLARLVDVCLAIELAHQRGVIHRDLKPSNIMLGDFGETYVLDWGLARIANASDAGAIAARDLRGEPDASGETVAGAMLGTPGYMAPEQMRGEAIDHRVDVFALGLILYEILTGAPAVPRDSAFEATLAGVACRPSARDPEVPPELDDLCARATASERDERPQSARAVGDAIQRYLDGDRDLERRRELAGDHARRAATAFEAHARSEAVREAARAIALDPENRDALALMERLMLDRPRVVPDEVLSRVEHEKQTTSQSVLRAGAVAYALNLVLAIVIKLCGVGGTWPFVAFGALIVPVVVICLVMSMRPRRIGVWLYLALLVMHVSLLTLVGIVLGPLLVLPIYVFGALPLIIMLPSLPFMKTTFAGHLLAYLVPLVAESLHFVPATYGFEHGALVIHPWAVDMSPRLLVGIAVTCTLIQILISTNLFIRQRRAQEAAQRQIHLQAWQLGQLLPEAQR